MSDIIVRQLHVPFPRRLLNAFEARREALAEETGEKVHAYALALRYIREGLVRDAKRDAKASGGRDGAQ